MALPRFFAFVISRSSNAAFFKHSACEAQRNWQALCGAIFAHDLGATAFSTLMHSIEGQIS